MTAVQDILAMEDHCMCPSTTERNAGCSDEGAAYELLQYEGMDSPSRYGRCLPQSPRCALGKFGPALTLEPVLNPIGIGSRFPFSSRPGAIGLLETWFQRLLGSCRCFTLCQRGNTSQHSLKHERV